MCKILGQEEIRPHKVRYYLERRDAEFEQKMAEVLCVYREVQILKRAAAKSRKAIKRVAIVSYDEKPGMGGLFSRVLVAMAGGFSNPMGRANKRCPLGFAVICGFAAAICGIASDGTIYGTGYSQVKAALESGSQLPASFSCKSMHLT